MQRASLMLLTGARIAGEQACEWGLADRVADLAHLTAAALDLARELCANAPLAMASTRATLRRGLVDALAEATRVDASCQAALMDTRDFREGVAAVAERRPGRFTGH